jgi:periplasmic protein TonB
MALGLAPSPHPTSVTDPSVALNKRDREERMRRLSWLASALLHAVVLALLLGLWKSPHVDEFPPIEVALIPGMGDAGTAGGTGGGASKEGPLAQGSEEPTPNHAADAAPPEATAKETTEAQPVPPTPEPQPTETPPAPPTPPQPTTATTTTPTPAKPLEPIPPPPPRKPTPPQPTAVAAAPPPPVPAKPAPQPAPSPAPLPQVATAPVPSPTPGTPGVGTGRGGPGGVGQGEAGAGHGIVGSGNGPGDDYLERVRRWINKYKNYPDAAKKQKQQGGPLLAIRLRRDGTVLDVQIDKSSGFPLLDEAALKAVRDASPVPPFPASYTDDVAEIDLPFKFQLGFFDRVFD